MKIDDYAAVSSALIKIEIIGIKIKIYIDDVCSVICSYTYAVRHTRLHHCMSIVARCN